MEGVKAINPLWEFALDYYASEDVAQCLLALQDEDGYQINVLILAVWLSSKGLKLHKLPAREEQAARWYRDVSVNIRALRKSVKLANSEDDNVEILLAHCYKKILSAELAVEEVELMLLYQRHLQWSEPFNTGEDVLARLTANLSCYWHQMRVSSSSSDDHELRKLKLLESSHRYLESKISW